MSETDSFIEEVTEEVRRDRLYGLLRKYGWIGVLVVLLVVGGTAWQAYQSNQQTQKAQALGDAMLNALDNTAPDARAAALSTIDAGSDTALALRDFLLAAAQLEDGDAAAARTTLQNVENNAELPLIYRQIASFKGLAAAQDALSVTERRTGFEALAQPGNPLRLLAEEQLALLDIEIGTPNPAIERFQRILEDAEATPDLQQRALQVIVALGGDPQLGTDAPSE